MADQTAPSGQPKNSTQDIARLNDWLRDHIFSPGHNRVVMTSGIAALIGDTTLFRGFHKQAELLRAVRDFDDFDAGIDPHGERDMGRFTFEDVGCYWKIDYFNLDLSAGSEDPADPFTTIRVLTIMQAAEW